MKILNNDFIHSILYWDVSIILDIKYDFSSTKDRSIRQSINLSGKFIMKSMVLSNINAMWKGN